MSDRPASSDPAGKSPDRIERDIEHTRAELALTVDALERRLDARQLLEKGIDMLKDNFGSYDGLNRSLDVVRANPVPFALMGIGAAWLIAAKTGVVDRIADDERVAAARRRVSDMAGDIGNRATDLASGVASRVGLSGNDRALGHTGNPVFDQESGEHSDGWVHQATDMAQNALRSARDTAGQYAGGPAGRVVDQVNGVFDRSPLIIGAVGMMAGGLLAALLPRTGMEDEWLGGTRDQLLQQAESAGQEAISRVREAATRAVDAATDAATQRVRETATGAIGAAAQAVVETVKGELGASGSSGGSEKKSS